MKIDDYTRRGILRSTYFSKNPAHVDEMPLYKMTYNSYIGDLKLIKASR